MVILRRRRKKKTRPKLKMFYLFDNSREKDSWSVPKTFREDPENPWNTWRRLQMWKDPLNRLQKQSVTAHEICQRINRKREKKRKERWRIDRESQDRFCDCCSKAVNPRRSFDQDLCVSLVNDNKAELLPSLSNSVATRFFLGSLRILYGFF